MLGRSKRVELDIDGETSQQQPSLEPVPEQNSWGDRSTLFSVSPCQFLAVALAENSELRKPN